MDLERLFTPSNESIVPLPLDVEHDLIERARHGDDGAMEDLLLAYAPALRVAVRSITSKLDDWAAAQVKEDARATVLAAFVELVYSFDTTTGKRLASVITSSLTQALNELTRVNASSFSIPGRTIRRFFACLREADNDVAAARRLAIQTGHMDGASFDLILAAVKSGSLPDSDVGATNDVPESVEVPTEYLDEQLLVNAAFAALDDDTDARIIELAYGFTEYEPQPDAEIAYRVHMPQRTVCFRRNRSLRTMRKALGVTYRDPYRRKHG